MAMSPGTGMKAGKTYRMRLIASIDGAVWNITGATVTLILKDQDGNVTEKTANITSASDGTAEYTTTITDLTAGTWELSWEVSQSGVVLESETEEFQVAESLRG